MVEKSFTNHVANAERFKFFFDQLNEFTQVLNTEKNAVDKAMKYAEMQQQEGELAFEERVAEDKVYFAEKRKYLERELQKSTEFLEKLSAQNKEWSEKQNELHDELMAQLEADDVIRMEWNFGDQFSALIDSINNLSHQSMNNQFEGLQNNLDSLNIEKKQLAAAIADQCSTLSDMSAALAPTFGVSYKERNTMRISIRHQVTKVRTEYQKSRLIEESLKARLSN
uniref:Uncharacterized protein n=1 Tax=Caenorhabditis japonica TaxID=281687 RepID=A0A8R1E098_CAEJA